VARGCDGNDGDIGVHPMRYLVSTLLLLWSASGLGAPPAVEDLPEPLRPWVPWVLHEHRDLDCPLAYGGEGRTCVWPGELLLDADEQGARFTQSVVVYREGRVLLPGDRGHWPEEVTADGLPVEVVGGPERPAVHLPAGTGALPRRPRASRPAHAGCAPGCAPMGESRGSATASR